MNNIIDFFEKFLRSGGTVSFTEFSNFNKIDQTAFLTAGLLVEEYKYKKLEKVLVDVLLPEEINSRIKACEARILKRNLENKIK